VFMLYPSDRLMGWICTFWNTGSIDNWWRIQTKTVSGYHSFGGEYRRVTDLTAEKFKTSVTFGDAKHKSIFPA